MRGIVSPLGDESRFINLFMESHPTECYRSKAAILATDSHTGNEVTVPAPHGENVYS